MGEQLLGSQLFQVLMLLHLSTSSTMEDILFQTGDASHQKALQIPMALQINALPSFYGAVVIESHVNAYST